MSNEEVTTSHNISKHIPYSIAYKFVCHHDISLNKCNLYRGKNPEMWFINELAILSKDVGLQYQSANYIDSICSSVHIVNASILQVILKLGITITLPVNISQ